jgi:hypothetical protein
MVKPILCYGSELWGYERCEQIERVHIKFCKKLLKVGSSATNCAVLGEVGRYPLHISYMRRLIVYWVKLLRMPDSRYPKQCYHMLVKLDTANRITWATRVRNLLAQFGFNFIWFSQEVGDSRAFLALFTQRLSDCALQDWNASIQKSSKLSCYSTFKSLLEPEKYLSTITCVKYRIAISKFRISNHPLHIESGRHTRTLLDDRICKYCITESNHQVIEDEKHFLLDCPLYTNIRNANNIKIVNSSALTFVHLLSTTNPVQLWQLGKFIFEAFSCRKQYLCLQV